MKSNDASNRAPNRAVMGGDPLDASQLAESRLTAYVLGELDAAERAAVETELAASEAVRQQIVGIRRSVEMVTATLANERAAEVPFEQRERRIERVANQSREVKPLPVQRHPIRRVLSKYILAACVLLCVTGALAALLLPATQSARESASRAVAYNNLRQPRADLGAAAEGAAAPVDASTSFAGLSKAEIRSRMASIRPEEMSGQVSHDYVSTVKVPASLNGRYSADGTPAMMGGMMMGGMMSSGSIAGRNVPARRWIDPQSHSAYFEFVDNSESTVAPLEGFREPRDGFNSESYDRIYENAFLDVQQNPLSTFSIDVDTASYANVRRFLTGGALPPKDAVRIEELLNYFTYHYAPPMDDKPFAVHAEVAGCPWEPKHRLLRIALKGREIDLEDRPASNLVFLIDVSGSMDDPAKLPLLKSALRLLVDKLGENDCVAMVVYAGSSGLVLPSTSGLYKDTILAALDQLQAGGSTNGGSGIQLAYNVAREKFIKGGTNRVILCTDGDFNVGVTDQGSLTRLIEDEAKSGVFLSVLGFGGGNLKDSTMEKLADRGNGNYSYIDTHNEARKVLVEQLGGTLVTIAKDVKLQLEFNPRQVAAYRLIGYENRLLRAEDFNDDRKDAGEIGAGHTVTALYELVPAGGDAPTSPVDGLKYQRTTEATDAAASDESLTLKLRYKEPDGDTSTLIESVVKDGNASYARASEDFRFATAVAGFGLLLRDSQFKGNLTWGAVLELAQASRGTDETGYRAEFIELVKKAQSIGGR
jgi:Ca-activated chloride channel family protein